jgi:shikimate dehydrogenase
MRSFEPPEGFYAVIGDPVAQSMSPDIHNACLKNAGLPERYKAVRVKADELEQAVSALVDEGCKGFNVTIPHKRSILKLLDEIDPYAEAIGAVNTVVVTGNRLKGYNTDGPGFYKGLKQFYNGKVSAGKILVLGAGGAARAIVKTFLMNGILDLSVANRSIDKAEELVVGSHGRAYTLDGAEGILKDFDIVINTTPIGMVPHTNAIPIDLVGLDGRSTLIDIIYNPLETAFLQHGKRKGCVTLNGVSMFVHQAELAFQKWTGQEPDVPLMYEIINSKLGGNSSC